jgi:hypothetical protein
MKINLWRSEHEGQWRWTLCDEQTDPFMMESGQRPNLHAAMEDIANTVEYMLES